MAEKDATVRLRRAVKENNLFLVKRLIQRTDMRNPDPGPKRYTSLAWAAVLGHEETFEFLLTAGHDDEELSRESENNTILMLLADFKSPPSNPYAPGPSQVDLMGAALRMARLYYERYPWILDWSNIQGKTALHMAALKGNEELVRMLCDLGADFDLSDNKGNTPLHYASSWGHIPIVQLLIERGCQFAARNNDGFTASDYAYSFSTRDTLQDSARMQFETNKKSRRMVFAQAAARGNEWPIARPPPIPLKPPSVGRNASRMRSSSGGSRTTATSDSGDVDSAGQGQEKGTSLSSLSASSTTSQPSRLPSHQYTYTHSQRSDNMSSASSTGTFPSPGPSQGLTLNPPLAQPNSLSPIVNRMRERDADEIEKYMRRNRSGSAGTASTDNKSQNGNNFTSAGPSANGDDITALASLAITGSTAPRRSLRPSFSAAQLRTTPSPLAAQTQNSQAEALRNRSGTNPSSARPAQTTLSPIPVLTRASSSDTSQHEEKLMEGSETFTGPPTLYAQFPEPPKKGVRIASSATAAAISRRLPSIFSSKSSPAQPPPTPAPVNDLPQGHHSHRRGSSAASSRG
ncbi:ankyrin repeat-containing domain protein [Suillus bovinus]|uniref:ankyrin repeat-containing domain protein n=1 Tax=Suillus bovinus TaxID=48563 RepID=UPI001B871816|nr:ankyrin repeat-containing domain protein [Suillus bovinus]KAG2154915.1 ankyrin repeat-containing domain protein [Suillus bovinus]